jgi:hypothetical protein
MHTFSGISVYDFVFFKEGIVQNFFYTEGLKGQADHGQLEKFSDP